MADELPSGTVTFLFSDIEGSTRLLQRLGDRWGDVVTTHNRIMRAAFEQAGGREVDRQGDAFFAVFPRARNALAAAATAQRDLAAHDWPADVELRVRMGIHTGEPSLGDEGYLGVDVVRAARICALARGGQVLVSESTRVLARGDLGDLELRDAGEHELKDVEGRERLFQLAGPGLRADLPVPAGKPPSVTGPLGLAGREVALASQALAQLRALELGPLESLGPRIDEQVQAALSDASRGERDATDGDASPGRKNGERLPARARRPTVPGVAPIAVLLAVLVALVYVLIRALV